MSKKDNAVADSDWQPREVMVLLYQARKTNVGHDMYVCVQCFREEYPGQESASAYRQSSPYVLSRQHGSRRVIPGSVCESLKNLRLQIQEMGVSLNDRVARIEAAEDDQRATEYYDYDRYLTNSLVLISCLARNLFHTFPRLSEEFSVQMFDYGGKEAGEIRLKELLDLFVHNRYMNVRNEYITDLVSQKPPKGTVVAEEFMGHRFKVQDFLTQIQQAIESVTIKDLMTRLRGCVRSLTLDTPYQEIVFLVQNTESFSELLQATIPSASYDFILNTLFPGSEIPEAAWAAAKGDEIQQTVKFRNPHVRVGHRVDEKKVTISVNAELEYSASGHVVHQATEERRKDLDYADFFDEIVQRFGQERLLDLVRRIEALRAGGRLRSAVVNG